MSGSLEALIFRCIERHLAGRYHERHGLVTAYDPDKYLAKVMIQPEGFETGWLPIETGHIGNGYGIAVGLTPGSGQGASGQGGAGNQSQTNSENTGDQVIVRFQEGDFESGKIVQRVHSDKDKPPKVQSGEMVYWAKTKNGQQRVYFKNDGSLRHYILDANENAQTAIVMTGSSITHQVFKTGSNNNNNQNSGNPDSGEGAAALSQIVLNQNSVTHQVLDGNNNVLSSVALNGQNITSTAQQNIANNPQQTFSVSSQTTTNTGIASGWDRPSDTT